MGFIKVLLLLPLKIIWWLIKLRSKFLVGSVGNPVIGEDKSYKQMEW